MKARKRDSSFSSFGYVFGTVLPELALDVLLGHGVAVLSGLTRVQSRQHFRRKIAEFLADGPAVNCGPDGIRFAEPVAGFVRRKITSDQWSVHFRLISTQPRRGKRVGLHKPRPRIASRRARSGPIFVYTFSTLDTVESAKVKFLQFAGEAFQRSKAPRDLTGSPIVRPRLGDAAKVQRDG